MAKWFGAHYNQEVRFSSIFGLVSYYLNKLRMNENQGSLHQQSKFIVAKNYLILADYVTQKLHSRQKPTAKIDSWFGE